MDAAEITDALGAAGYRLTGPRRSLSALIAGWTGHFTAEELLEASRRRRLGVGRATVFRSLEVLTELGVVERLDLPSGGHAYVACEPVHHHHVVCSSCGCSTEVGDLGLGAVAASIEQATGYRIDAHRLELFGLCPACRDRALA